MKDLSPAYVDNFTLFAKKLRSRGLTVGIAEVTDVIKLMDKSVLNDRNSLRVSMRSILAKSTREQEIFDEVFDDFFVPPAVVQRQEIESQQAEEARVQNRQERIDELKFDGKDIELPENLKDVYAEMDESKREKLKNYLGISTTNQRRSPFTYNFMRRILEQHLRMEDALEDAENDAGIGGGSPDLLYKDISKIGDDEMPKAVALINKMVKQLDGAISRKYRRSGKTGRLDFRATIRANMASGGSLYKLKYRRRPKSRKRLILLCDVSGSMLKYSEFAIRFIKSMSETSDSSKIYVFSEGTMELNRKVLEDMSGFQKYVKDNGLWGKGTDLTSSLEYLMAKRPALLSSNTILMIISDTKSTRLEDARRAMHRTTRMAGRTIWLNPIPSAKWQKMGSVTTFMDLCEMLDCSTIDELSRACAKSLN